ncbi:hypothetical protein OBJ99_03075 [Empedobacter falsenii]
MNRIKYIGFYNHNSSIINRTCALSAVNKMDYVISSLNEIGYGVDIISPSWLVSTEKSFFKRGETISLANNNYIYSPSLNTKNKILNYITIILSWVWLFFYLLFKVKRNEKIIIYHSIWLLPPLIFIRLFKELDIILEVEEIYSDVNSLHKKFKKKELKFIRNSNSFIFSTDLLEKKINLEKPSVILYGNYKVFPRLNKTNNDNKIHLLYAGIIDKDKAGAFNAVEAMRFLDEKYILHVIGFGEIEELKEKIRIVNSLSKAMIFYDGLKTGDDFIIYAQKCHIGLSTQKMEGEYLDTSFPSKILTYLGLGLNVVSCNIRCVEVSAISELVSSYSIDKPEQISKSIQEVELKSSQEITEKLNLLNNNFKNKLIEIITK